MLNSLLNIRNIDSYQSSYQSYCNNNSEFSSLFLSQKELNILNKNQPTIVLNFKYSWFTMTLPFNTGISIPYVSLLINYFENNGKFFTTTVKKIKEIYIIEIERQFYENISNVALNQLKLFLENNSFRSVISIDKIVKKQIIDFIDSLSGINENIVLFYTEFKNSLII